MKKSIAMLALCLTGMGISNPLYGADYSQNLSGGWGGKRAALSEKGIDIEGLYTQDILTVPSGGRKDDTAIGLASADLKLKLDGEKLYNAKGSHVMVELLGTAGSSPRSLTGSWQKTDNIELLQRGPHSGQQHTLTLFQAWVEQEFMDNRTSLKAGLYDLSSEFYVTETSRLFLGKTYQTGLEFEQTGKNGPSVYPVTAPAIRAKFLPTANTYVQLALLDEVAGVPNHPYGVQFHLEPEDGALTVAEVGYKSAEYGHYAIGGWHYNSKFADIYDTDASGNKIMRNGNQGAYLIAEKQLCPRVSGFARFGLSDQDVNSGAYAWSTGLVYDKPVPGRKDSKLGLAYSTARNSEKWNRSQADIGLQSHWNEGIVELTYQDKPTEWLAIQPDVQYIMNPNTDPNVKNAWLVGTRVQLSF